MSSPNKPLGRKAYGSIPHLPGSRRGSSDKGLSDEQARILTHRARDEHDHVVVQEKLDGSNVAVAKLQDVIIPLIRAGYEAIASKWKQHHHFANWVFSQQQRFHELLENGERASGEWLMEAHGTRYELIHEPFVIFDILTEDERTLTSDLVKRCGKIGFITPRILHQGGPASIPEILAKLEPSGHGAIDPVEGAVWRLERKGKVEFLGKYVRPEKEDGKYLDGADGIKRTPIYHWLPPGM